MSSPRSSAGSSSTTKIVASSTVRVMGQPHYARATPSRWGPECRSTASYSRQPPARAWHGRHTVAPSCPAQERARATCIQVPARYDERDAARVTAPRAGEERGGRGGARELDVEPRAGDEAARGLGDRVVRD